MILITMIKTILFFSLPVGPVDIVAFSACLDCDNVSKKGKLSAGFKNLPTQDFLYCT